MRAVVQRVRRARVDVGENCVGRIEQGLLIFLGVGEDDEDRDSDRLAEKIAHLRVFSDEDDLMNLSLIDIEGAALVVSQFTLFGDCRKGRRPSFARAARPGKARKLYERFILDLQAQGIPAAAGAFQQTMEVHLVNDGPVTLLLDSRKTF